MNICLERRSISKAAITLSCCSFLFIASTQKPVAQTQTADTGNVNIFKALCYNVMPDIGKIKTMASRFRWVPITNQKKLQLAAPPNADVTSLNGWLVKNRGGTYQLMAFSSSLSKNFSVLKNYTNARQYRCFITALNMTSAEKQAEAFKAEFKAEPKQTKRTNGGVTYRWLPRASKKSLTMVRLITTPGKPNGVVLMDLLINP